MLGEGERILNHITLSLNGLVEFMHFSQFVSFIAELFFKLFGLLEEVLFGLDDLVFLLPEKSICFFLQTVKLLLKFFNLNILQIRLLFILLPLISLNLQLLYP